MCCLERKKKRRVIKANYGNNESARYPKRRKIWAPLLGGKTVILVWKSSSSENFGVGWGQASEGQRAGTRWSQF